MVYVLKIIETLYKRYLSGVVFKQVMYQPKTIVLELYVKILPALAQEQALAKALGLV